MTFQYEDNIIFAENENGKVVAKITFPAAADGKVDITHTFVRSSLRGQGIADELMQEAVRHFQSKKLKVTTSCPYAQEWFQRHPEFSDLLEG